MKKAQLFVVLILLPFLFVQCTEDETVDEAVYTSGQHSFFSGEEGADGVDTEKE